MKDISKEERFDSLEDVQATVKECFKRVVKKEEKKTMKSFVLITGETAALVGSKEDLLKSLGMMIVRLKEFATRKEIESIISSAIKFNENDKKSRIENIVNSIFGEDADE